MQIKNVHKLLNFKKYIFELFHGDLSILVSPSTSADVTST